MHSPVTLEWFTLQSSEEDIDHSEAVISMCYERVRDTQISYTTLLFYIWFGRLLVSSTKIIVALQFVVYWVLYQEWRIISLPGDKIIKLHPSNIINLFNILHRHVCINLKQLFRKWGNNFCLNSSRELILCLVYISCLVFSSDVRR
jgi:hypothetical protein